MMKAPTSRRKFIRSIVGGAAASKLMTLMPHAAFAQAAAPKRLLCVFHPMGYLENSFWPTGEGAGFTLGETQQALNPHKAKLLYVDGLVNSGRAYWEGRWAERDNEHGSGINGVFTGSWIDGSGYSASASIDQAVANALYAKFPTPFKSISLGMSAGGGGHGNAFFVSGGNPVKPMNATGQAFDTLFANLKVQMGTMAPPDNSAFLKERALQKRVVDNARAELKAVCARIGNAEKQMCDAHLEGLNQLEARITSQQPGVTAGCSKPGTPGADADPQSGIRARMDLIRSGFACDLSRVATLQIGGADGGPEPDGFPGQHQTTHAAGEGASAGVLADHKKWDAWYASHWAYLLQQLDSVKEGNGTLLDNTLIVFGSDTTTGQSRNQGAHEFYRFPLWMAGGSNFAFKTGRTIKVTMPAGKPTKAWTYHNQLLVSIGRAFGMDMNAFGTWDAGKGPLSGLA